jgi:SAM-dependent methyltransferase
MLHEYKKFFGPYKLRLKRYKRLLNPYQGLLFIHKQLYYYYDKKNGVDFTRNAGPAELGLDPNESYEYEPSGNWFLKKILKDLKITPADKILDVGCGKGSAMKTMLDFPFSTVDGIEISDRLCSIAENNFKVLNVTNARVFNIDATKFFKFDDYNYIYFFNPFPKEVMEKVVYNLLQSIQRRPRKVTLIYDNPTCHETIANTGVFKKAVKEYRDIMGFKIFLYTNQNLSLAT